jgi:hypothetical protein
VSIHAETNKELTQVHVESIVGEQPGTRTPLEQIVLDGDCRGFRCDVSPIEQDTTLLLKLSDTDGITAREPVTLVLRPLADSPPQLSVHLQGIGTAITPQARLPVIGRITDDYGIASVVFEYSIDQQSPATLSLPILDDHPASLPMDDIALEAQDLELSPGQKLLVGLKATDLYDLADAPNVGTSERWLLDIVTAEQLRAMLEARELVLRQRFEEIIREVDEMCDLLLRVDFGTPEGEVATESLPDEGAEPGDEPEVLTPERLLDLRTWRVRRALTNSGKNAQETRGVAEGFDHIRLQLINNQLGADESVRRIGEGIAQPLLHIADEMFPALQMRLERLHESLEDEQLGPQRRDFARAQANEILLEMRRVLDRMLELEDFNEAVELLRTIIELQEQLQEDTRQRHKDSLRELWEDDQ